MKSLIALLFAVLASASALAKPIQAAPEPLYQLSPAPVAQIGIDAGEGESLESLALAPSGVEAMTLNESGTVMTFRRLPRFEKYCRSGPRNAWGFGDRCYETRDDAAAVPEPASLLLLGTGLALIALARRGRRRDPVMA